VNAKDPRTTALRLNAWLQEEIGAQRRLDALLAEEERAIRAVDTPAILAAGERVQAELRASAPRERRRQALMADLGRAWGVDPRALTLASIAARLGAGSREADLLLRQRADLRAVAAEVARRGRRIASLARYHAGLFGELLNTLLGVEGRDTAGDGVLVDAKV
jgi:hypothetical protein